MLLYLVKILNAIISRVLKLDQSRLTLHHYNAYSAISNVSLVSSNFEWSEFKSRFE